MDYLFSFGKIDKDIVYREIYSTIYWSLNYLITELFPLRYQMEVSHLVNLTFSLGAIFGAAKLSKELFNKKLGKIVFIILFFYPIFFGHMPINNKDNIIAFSHIWMVYLILRYLKKQNINKKANQYIISLGILGALSTGIQLIFLGSLMPIILIVLMEVFFLKKIINKNFSIKNFFYDLIKCFLIFYFLLILFWIDVHQNILFLPVDVVLGMFSTDFWSGWPYNLINGNYYSSNDVPKSYLLINLFYKSPEYILILYLFFLVLIFKSRSFYKIKFKLFDYKLSFIILMLLFPNLILFLIPFPIYDGMRLFLWVLPYFCIIPGLTIYYLLENINLKMSKFSLVFLSIFIIYFLFNFFSITPYHYTYLNFLNGKTENRYKKFENDYWSTSLNELIRKTNFKTNESILMATCGASLWITKKYLRENGYYKIKFVSSDKANYIVMTNRVTDHNGPLSCFEKFRGKDVYKVERNGLLLSVIRKIN